MDTATTFVRLALGAVADGLQRLADGTTVGRVANGGH